MIMNETNVKTLSYYLLVALTLLLSVICLFYQLNQAFTLPEEPIRPTNPIGSTADSSAETSETKPSVSESSSASTEASSEEKTNTSSSKKETKPATLSPLNLILTATLDNEETGEDIIKTYLVKEPLGKSEFDVRIKQVTLAKLTENSMKSTGYAGEGILDVELSLNNQTEEDVFVFPEKIVLEVNGVSEPVTIVTDFTDSTVKPKEKRSESFLTAFPKLDNIEDVLEFNFTWATEVNRITQPYNITILLKDK